jgi:hypothetical protein
MFIHTYTEDQPRIPRCTRCYVAAFGLKDLKDADLDAIGEWCYNTFGAPGWRPWTAETRWTDNIRFGEIAFSRKEDLEWFVLRWR